MVAHDMGKVSDAVVTEHLRRLDQLGMLTFAAIYTGALPIPNMDLMVAHTATIVEYLATEHPEIIQAIRTFETSLTMAGVLSVWTANASVFSGQFGEARDIIDRQNGVIKPKDIALVTPYLNVNYEIAYFCLAHAIYSATNPLAYKIMRWLAEEVGGYAFVKYNKTKDRLYSHGGVLPTTTGESTLVFTNGPQGATDEQLMLAAEIEDSLFGETNAFTETQWLSQFGDWYFTTCSLPSIVCLDPASKPGDSSSTSAARARNKTTRHGLSNRITHNGPPMTVDEFYEMEGNTVQLPIAEQTSSKAGKARFLEEACSILSGHLEPEDYVNYKRNPDGKNLNIDPNYILVKGSRDYFATYFAQQNSHMKLSRDNIMTELSHMSEGTTLFNAHLLPQIRADPEDQERAADILVAVEHYRTELMRDPRCVRKKVPVILPSSQGIYILVEALFSSPKNIVLRALDYLCCEGTPNINMVLPIARSRSTAHLLKEYSAKQIDGRCLVYSNPLYTPDAERPFLGRDILDSLDLRNHTGSTLRWTKDSELESIREHFDENGIEANPENYTFAAIHKRLVAPI
jgi:hypothetical protein